MPTDLGGPNRLDALRGRDMDGLDDGDRTLLGQCPFKQYADKATRNRAISARLKRIARLTKLGFVRGKILRRVGDGWDMEISLTRNGRVALGLNPEPPVS